MSAVKANSVENYLLRFIWIFPASKLCPLMATFPSILFLFTIQTEFHSPVVKLLNCTFFDVKAIWTFNDSSSAISIKTTLMAKYLATQTVTDNIYQRNCEAFWTMTWAISGQVKEILKIFNFGFRFIGSGGWFDKICYGLDRCSCLMSFGIWRKLDNGITRLMAKILYV